MPYDTDERLKGYLDTNQMHREQMCLAVMANRPAFFGCSSAPPARRP
jgi:hypothetical protein